MEKTTRWRQEEIDVLRKNFTKMTYQELGKLLGRSKDAVRVKAENLGLLKRHPINRKESICFSCANAYAGKCAWVDMSKQVWMHAKVKETKEGRFYIVESCKNFIPDLREEVARA